jgi:hypothetical protein
MPPKPRVEFTLARKQQFLELYRATGLKYRSGEIVGVSSRTVDQHCKDDPEFGEAVEEAKQRWIDDRLVAAAIERATDGIEEDVFGGRFKDEVVGTKRIFSDGLLMQLLKAKRAEYRDGDAASGGGSGGGIMMIPAASPTTMDDWQAQHGEAAKGQTGKDAHK